MPLKLKLDVALAQLADAMRKLGMECVVYELRYDYGTGEVVAVDPTTGERIGQPPFELDHRPALARRAVRADGAEWNPHQHDPRFLIWRPKPAHARLTTGRNGESRFSSNGGGDTSQAGKVKRLETETRARQTAEARRRFLAPDAAEPAPPAKPKSRLQGRPFQKSHRPLRSRNTLERRS